MKPIYDTAGNIRKGEELNWGKLEAYLKVALPELEGDMAVTQFHGGHANLTYLLKFGEKELVLRRPPFGKIAPGAHDMKREYKVLSKLYRHFSPAPRAYHLCLDEAVIGAKFVVLERRKGVIVRTVLPACFKDFGRVEERLSSAMIKAEATLHKVDVESAGLSQLGRPEGFVQRQLAGWSKRWELVKAEGNNAMDEVLTLLHADIPKPQAVSIVHNDIKLDNCQFQANNPDEVSSIFDWDMATLGDPLVDLGSTLSYWQDDFLASFDLPVMLSGNYPDKEFLIQNYALYTGFSVDRIAWYEALAYWKGAVIAQQLFQRFVRGETKDLRMSSFGNTTSAFAKLAKHILQSAKA